MSETLQQSEQHSLSMMYGTYADILLGPRSQPVASPG